MKLNKAFLVHHTGKQSVLVPAAGAAFSGVVQGNRTLGAILELLKNDTSEEEMVHALAARFDAEEETIRADVEKALSELRKIGALDRADHHTPADGA